VALLISGFKTLSILKADQDPDKLKKFSGSRNPKTARVLGTISIVLGVAGILYCGVLILRSLL
jgi:hypothetical protein